MDGKQAMCSVVTILLVLATFSISPIGGQIICPWCDKSKQSSLLDCVYTGMISRPELLMIPLQYIDDIKWQVASYSDSMAGMPYDVKKVKVDEKFVREIANVIKKSNYQNNYLIINVISDLAGHCYSSVTGYDPEVVAQDVKAMVKDDMRKMADSLRRNPNPNPNSRMPYPANQNQPSNFQSSQPQIQQPLNNAPFNPPGPSPVNSYDNPPFVNNAPLNPPGSSPVNSYDNPPFVNNAPLNPPGSSPINSYGNHPFVNNAPFNPPGSSPVNSFNNPTFGSNAPLNSPVSPPMNPSNNPSFVNNAAGPPENWPSNDYEGQGRAKSDLSKNQSPSSSPPGSSLQNDNESQGFKNSPDAAALASTASPKVSSPSQDSKSTDLDSSENSNWTTPSPNTDAPQKKSADNEKSDDEEQPCDEKFKIALYEKLINDDRFCTFFGKLPISATKPEVPKIIMHAFKEYGIKQHYTEFSTFWRFESKTLNKESTVEDWDEIISKILKIIFSRNNLLKGDCEEAGEKMAGCILDTFPGDPEASSTENTNQNDGNDETSTESNSNPSGQKANTASNSTANTPAENNSDKSTDSGNLSFPELHSKLANISKHDGTTGKNDSSVPFSELLSTFETQENLEKLHRAAESCISPSGFDFKTFLVTMTNVTDSIENNHPDWSHDKCQKEMYSATVAVLTKVLQDTLKSSNSNAKSQSSSMQPDSSEDASDSQSSNSGAQPEVPNDYDLSSDDSTYPGPGSDFVSGSVPQPQQDFKNYGDYADGTKPENIPPPQNQPGPGDWNTGLIQPSNFAPGPANTNYGDLSNGNLQNAPLSQPSAPNFPKQDNSAGPSTSMKTQPYSRTQPFPAKQNTGFQQSPIVSPDSGVMNSPNGNFGNNDYGFNAGPSESRPVEPNGGSQNFQPRLNQDYDFGVPADGTNYNNQPQLNSNYNNNRASANGPNYNNQPQLNSNYNNNRAPADGPNYSNQPQFNSNYNRAPADGPNYNTQSQFDSNYNRAPANGPVNPQW